MLRQKKAVKLAANLYIVSKNINNLENLPRYLGLLKDPLTLFSSIYLIETLRDMASTSYIYKIDLGNSLYNIGKTLYLDLKK